MQCYNSITLPSKNLPWSHTCQIDVPGNPKSVVLKQGMKEGIFCLRTQFFSSHQLCCCHPQNTPTSSFFICSNDLQNYYHLNPKLPQVLCLPAGYHGSITSTDCSISATCSCMRQRIIFHLEKYKLLRS